MLSDPSCFPLPFPGSYYNLLEVHSFPRFPLHQITGKGSPKVDRTFFLRTVQVDILTVSFFSVASFFDSPLSEIPASVFRM